jgi:hypothetical protein
MGALSGGELWCEPSGGSLGRGYGRNGAAEGQFHFGKILVGGDRRWVLWAENGLESC